MFNFTKGPSYKNRDKKSLHNAVTNSVDNVKSRAQRTKSAFGGREASECQTWGCGQKTTSTHCRRHRSTPDD